VAMGIGNNYDDAYLVFFFRVFAWNVLESIQTYDLVSTFLIYLPFQVAEKFT
jgi:hypothetical protein